MFAVVHMEKVLVPFVKPHGALALVLHVSAKNMLLFLCLLNTSVPTVAEHVIYTHYRTCNNVKLG